MAISPSDEFIEIDGTKLECRFFGKAPSEAPTLVLLHEGLGSVALWKGFPEALAEATGLSVFAYSRAGYGKSDPVPLPRPLTYMHDEATMVLPKLLDAVGIHRGIFLGHSDGASIATIYTGSIQDHRVRGLLLLAPHFFVEDVTVASIRQARTDFDTGSLRERLAPYHNDVDAAFNGWADAWLDPDFRDWSIEDALAHIRVPTHIIQGLDDKYGTQAQADMAIEEAYSPVDVSYLPNCGHSPHHEKSGETIALVEAFLERLDAMEPAA
ncbi:MAG: alpha/beta hydrolase [Pseudomonadota bacterium]